MGTLPGDSDTISGLSISSLLFPVGGLCPSLLPTLLQPCRTLFLKLLAADSFPPASTLQHSPQSPSRRLLFFTSTPFPVTSFAISPQNDPLPILNLFFPLMMVFLHSLYHPCTCPLKAANLRLTVCVPCTSTTFSVLREVFRKALY